MRAAILVLFLVGCSDDDKTTTTTTDTGAASTDSSTDSATDSSTSDTATPTDSAGDAPACPGSIPKTGDPCTSEGQKCDWPVDCGPTAGDFATCTSGKWNVVHNPCTAGDTGPG